MHSFEWKGDAYNARAAIGHDPTEETTVTIHHHGDYSGNASINLPTRVGDPAIHHYTISADQARREGFGEGAGDYHIAELNVPIAALEAFILAKFQSELTGFIEDADRDALKFMCVLAKAFADSQAGKKVE